MRKLFFLIPVILFGFTPYPDFGMCYKKYKNYSIIPISKNYSISGKKPKHYVKYDDNLGIYLIKTHNKTYLHFKKSHLGVWIASITKQSVYSGDYAQYQTSLYEPAQISTKTKVGSVVSDIFCNPIGIGVKDGFLSKTYIYKFIKAQVPKKDYLKFMGILFDRSLVITKILPNTIASRHYLSTGGKIIKVNGKKVTSLRNFPTKNINSVTILQQGIEFTIKANQ